MERTIKYLAVLAVAVALVGCSTVRKGSGTTPSESGGALVGKLSAEPAATELTAGVRYEVSGRSFTGQLRMRRGRCIQLTAGLLGIEAFRVELFPDHIMLMDRGNRRYVVCHYADLPFRNTLALDYSMIEAIFWNRLFSPECVTPEISALKLGPVNQDGTVGISDAEWGHTFIADANSHLTSFVKSGTGWSFSVSYDDFTKVSSDFEFPQQMVFNIIMTGSEKSAIRLEMKLSGISSVPGSWKDATQPSSRMKSVGIDDILEMIGL